MNLFKKKKYAPINLTNQPSSENEPFVPDGLWVKCKNCGKIIYNKELGEYKTCPHCHMCFRLSAWERVNLTADPKTFTEFDAELSTDNPIDFPGYEKKIDSLKKSTGLNDAVVCGKCKIHGYDTYLAVMDSNFLMGSMGSVVGEKITRTFERAINEKLPIIIFTLSGGARMQEGIVSLMQMAKVSAAVEKHNKAGLLYVTVLTDPTTGGVTASFAMLGDIILSEPKALIGFAGPRVIEQTINQSLPESFQTAEFLLEHGFVDKIVKRHKMRDTLGKILRMHAS